MQYLRRGTSQGRQHQHLEDLEEILNTPAPSLNHELSRSVSEGSQHNTLTKRTRSVPVVLASQPSVSPSEAPLEGHQYAAQDEATDAAAPSMQASIHEQLLAWRSSAYRTAIAPFAAITSQTAAQSAQQAQASSPSWSQMRLHMPNVVEHLASNKGAAVAASVAGAAAGGAIAGPFGVAAGAKTGAFMIAVGAAAAGAAQQYYLPIKPAQAKPEASATHTSGVAHL